MYLENIFLAYLLLAYITTTLSIFFDISQPSIVILAASGVRHALDFIVADIVQAVEPFA